MSSENKVGMWVVVVMVIGIISQVVSYMAVDKILDRVLNSQQQVVVTVSENEVLLPENEAQIVQKPQVDVATNKSSTEGLQAEYEAITDVFKHEGVLNRAAGVNYFNGVKETYYNLPMEMVVYYARNAGLSEEEYPYWERSDGCKMLGDYIMVAAAYNVRPYLSTGECSLGEYIVVDTGAFALTNPNQIDVAVNW